MTEKKKLAELLHLEESLLRLIMFSSDMGTRFMENVAGGPLKVYSSTRTSSL